MQIESDLPTEAPPSAQSPRSRRLLWWGLLGGGGVLCGLAVMAGLIWNRGRTQERKVQALERFDASIYGDYGPYQYRPPITSTSAAGATGVTLTLVYRGGQRPIGFTVMDEPVGAIAFAAPLFGEYCFTEVHDICVHNEEFSDADVPLLLVFPKLRKLTVSNCALTDSGVRQLLSLEHLLVLNVGDISLSAETLRRIAHCRELKELDINGTGADEETIEYLR
jgi:hypothetical protein